LVQPNVPLDDAELDRWAPWKDPTQLQRLVEFSVSAVKQSLPDAPIDNRKSKIENPPLLVWAENPAPFFFTRDPVFRNAMENMARQTHAMVITNTIIPLDANGKDITNSAITLD